MSRSAMASAATAFGPPVVRWRQTEAAPCGSHKQKAVCPKVWAELQQLIECPGVWDRN